MKKALLLFMITSLPHLALAAPNIDATYPHVWGENIGWINFRVSSGEVEVSDTGLSGNAWSSYLGWINLHPAANTYVHNDGNGNLSGYAWGESLGWINFSGVTIDSDGFFHGYATTADGGRISFNCANTSSCSSSDFKLRTDWRPASESETSAPVPGSGGGGNGPVLLAAAAAATSTTETGPADITGDGVYDVSDFNQLMVAWGEQGATPADLNKDGAVNLLDFNQLMVDWT